MLITTPDVLALNTFSLFVSPEPDTRSVKRLPHAHKNSLTACWRFGRRALLLGYSDVQIHCFPGSRFRHGRALKKLWRIQAAVRATKRKFRFADIWIPLINFSENIPMEQRETLEVSKKYIKKEHALHPTPARRIFCKKCNFFIDQEMAVEHKVYAYWSSNVNL